MHKVSRRGGFSDRNGIKPENIEIQLKDFDKRTRVQLQNMINNMYMEVYEDNPYYGNDDIQDFFHHILGNIYSEPIDIRETYYDKDIFSMLNDTFNNDEYDDVLTAVSYTHLTLPTICSV